MESKLLKLLESLSQLETKNDLLNKQIKEVIDNKLALVNQEASLMNQQEELKKELNWSYEKLSEYLRKGIK
jgi:septal ring factor EnvC (AmiA/AmiB activator)